MAVIDAGNNSSSTMAAAILCRSAKESLCVNQTNNLWKLTESIWSDNSELTYFYHNIDWKRQVSEKIETLEWKLIRI